MGLEIILRGLFCSAVRYLSAVYRKAIGNIIINVNYNYEHAYNVKSDLKKIDCKF